MPSESTVEETADRISRFLNVSRTGMERASAQATGVANSIAWQVGVATPGFLGLLWNGAQLSAHTHLAPSVFAGMYIGSGSCFGLAITMAIALYARVIHDAERSGRLASYVAMTDASLRARVGATEEVAASLDRLARHLEVRINQSPERRMATEADWFSRFRILQLAVAIVGYLLLAVLVATPSF